MSECDQDELLATRRLHGLNDNLFKEKSADEMFEDLGFKKSGIENIYIKYRMCGRKLGD